MIDNLSVSGVDAPTPRILPTFVLHWRREPTTFSSLFVYVMQYGLLFRLLRRFINRFHLRRLQSWSLYFQHVLSTILFSFYHQFVLHNIDAWQMLVGDGRLRLSYGTTWIHMGLSEISYKLSLSNVGSDMAYAYVVSFVLRLSEVI